MPTFGYILETAEERLYERGGEEAPRPAPTVPCPVCGEQLGSELDLATHLGAAHPLTAPRLLINGEAVVGERVLHRRTDRRRISLANATELLVSQDGAPPVGWSLAALRDAVADSDRVLLDLTLRNERAVDQASATERIRLQIQVADREDLAGVDAAFQTLASADIDEHAVDAFVDASRAFPTAARYAAALHEYAVGVLVKDQAPGTGAAMDFERFHDKYQRALDVLRHFPDRPLACAVAGFARFNFNDFHRDVPPSGVPVLDQCSERLASLALGSEARGHPPSGQSVAGRCPADEPTTFILECWARAEHSESRPRVVRDLLDRAESGRTTAADGAKCRALALHLGGEIGPHERLLGATRALTSDFVFGAWATRILEDAAAT